MRDADERDIQIATGTVPLTAEEELAYAWEARDLREERGVLFSPSECAVLASALDAVEATREVFARPLASECAQTVMDELIAKVRAGAS